MSDPSPAQPHVFDVTDATFDREVVERSSDVPVVVDFWASWCQPCRTLGPVLERLAAEYAGRFVLAKAEVEALPEVASRFAVRSIPAVFGVRQGRIVDSFVGAPPESSVRAWLDALMPTPAETLTAEARRLEATDPAAAEARYREAHALEPEGLEARVGLARMLVRLDRPDEARPLIEALEARGYLEPEAEAVKAEMVLRGQAKEAGGVGPLREALAASPDDPALRLKLAEALAATGAHAEALEAALGVVEAGDREGLGEEARKVMLNVFRLLPDDSELAADYRRKLSAALY